MNNKQPSKIALLLEGLDVNGIMQGFMRGAAFFLKACNKQVSHLKTQCLLHKYKYMYSCNYTCVHFIVLSLLCFLSCVSRASSISCVQVSHEWLPLFITEFCFLYRIKYCNKSDLMLQLMFSSSNVFLPWHSVESIHLLNIN